MSRWTCWNCLERYPRSKGLHPETLCHTCYKCMFKNPEKFHQRDPYNKYREELNHLGWCGLNRVRKPSLQVYLQVRSFFARKRRIRRKLQMVFWLVGIIVPKLQKDASSRAYAPGGIGYLACLSEFESLSVI